MRGVIVTLIDASGGVVGGTVTDDEGVYTLEAPPAAAYRLVTLHGEYERWQSRAFPLEVGQILEFEPRTPWFLRRVEAASRSGRP